MSCKGTNKFFLLKVKHFLKTFNAHLYTCSNINILHMTFTSTDI